MSKDQKTNDSAPTPTPAVAAPPPVVYVCKTPFSAWGKDYSKGDPIDISSWPKEVAKESLKRRIENDYVELSVQQ